VKPSAILAVAALLLMSAARAAGPAAAEKEVWSMEDAYWHYAQDGISGMAAPADAQGH
jgi:hypothetical protein